ncbi:MAG: SCP2 sterol-binding domain-containing protein [Anaerolineales bacterium]|jgi:putative sterol carrier protein|nr:SCP2 sterol-binding domain-containing protein [Anaerolineales bacterium]MDP7544464.1 SCP2 sterol-binding domain-containing protein [Anaerolineales bacterium]MDP7643535.1 SCP2 sterol-binding domain-containing protein [Anaerolineales bacterium]HJL70786.1 SCP2 sterol-binding domain-containing protein [Anaerolineales bacterium]HJN41527.1 SCP2 sterol-binding domain-containing protein [Anaerolineales bacterium]|tara:strand:- start:149 stop:490 length:342 start_codon:yes stop_codon:yes gene_type:complete
MAERAENIAQVFDLMPERFLPDQAGDMDSVIQMDLSGDDGGQWTLLVKDGALSITAGAHADADMTMSMQASDWLGIANGAANSMALFMQGKIRVSGDMGIAMKMQTMFDLSGG